MTSSTTASARPVLTATLRAALLGPLTAAFYTALPPARARDAAQALVNALSDGLIVDVFATARAFTVHRLGMMVHGDAVALAAARATLLYVRALDVIDGAPVSALDAVTFERHHVERMARHGVPFTLQQRLMLHRTEVAA